MFRMRRDCSFGDFLIVCREQENWWFFPSSSSRARVGLVLSQRYLPSNGFYRHRFLLHISITILGGIVELHSTLLVSSQSHKADKTWGNGHKFPGGKRGGEKRKTKKKPNKCRLTSFITDRCSKCFVVVLKRPRLSIVRRHDCRLQDGSSWHFPMVEKAGSFHSSIDVVLIGDFSISSRAQSFRYATAFMQRGKRKTGKQNKLT